MFWIGWMLGKLLGHSRRARRVYKQMIEEEVLKVCMVCDLVGIPRVIGVELFNSYIYANQHLTIYQALREVRDVIFLDSPRAN